MSRVRSTSAGRRGRVAAGGCAFLVIVAGLMGGTEVTAAQSATPTWSIQPSPNQHGADLTELFDVACTNSTACTAVGHAFTNPSLPRATDPTIERWNGRAWSVQATPPADGITNDLLGVACPTTRICFAVGVSDATALLERWNGATWTIQRSPSSSAAAGTSLARVACVNASNCVAVGYLTTSENDIETLIEHWNGSSWSIQPGPPGPPATRKGNLSGVSCVTASNCTAVGAAPDGSALIEHWNGGAWSTQARIKQHGASYSSLAGVSCPTATSCTAVGSGSTPANHVRTLVAHWNGTAWSIQASPNKPRAIENALYDVTCPAAMSCTAVGRSSNDPTKTPPQTLIEHWNGTAWTIEPSPNRPSINGIGNELSGVTCTSTHACTAVGGSAASTLVERRS